MYLLVLIGIKIIGNFTECSNGAVRLVGGQSSNEGRLEYCYYGAWTQLCNQDFHIEEAVAACRQLGYTSNPSKNLAMHMDIIGQY